MNTGRFSCDSKDGVFSLHISNVQTGDEGDYTCEAINSLGFVHTSGYLKIESPPVTHGCPEELFLPEDNNPKIKIFYGGDHPMQINITKNGEFIVDDGPHLKMTVFYDYVTFYIRSIAKYGAGLYDIEFVNDSGKASVQFIVNITGFLQNLKRRWSCSFVVLTIPEIFFIFATPYAFGRSNLFWTIGR